MLPRALLMHIFDHAKFSKDLRDLRGELLFLISFVLLGSVFVAHLSELIYYLGDPGVVLTDPDLTTVICHIFNLLLEWLAYIAFSNFLIHFYFNSDHRFFAVLIDFRCDCEFFLWIVTFNLFIGIAQVIVVLHLDCTLKLFGGVVNA